MSLKEKFVWSAIAAVAVVLGAQAAGRAAPQVPEHSKLDAALHRGSAGPVRVIVRTRPGASASLAVRIQQLGGSILKRHALVEAVTASVSSDEISVLENDVDVESISLDAPVIHNADKASDAVTVQNTLFPTLGLPVEELSGEGVGVAVIDSGIDIGGDFTGAAFYDFTGGFGPQAQDDHGHGTHVSGLIAGKGALSQDSGGAPYQGVAPKARIISLKVLDAQGRGLTSTVIEAIEFAVANRQTLGIDVMNLSLGHPILEPGRSDPLVQAVEAAVGAGIVVVVSAGNVGRSLLTGLPGYAGILSPGNAPSAITVGSVDTKNTTTRTDDAIPSYSSRGPTWYDGLVKPDIVAPGQNLVSDAAPAGTLFTRFPDRQVTAKGNVARFFRLSGTSMSAAVTSGVVALMIEASRAAHGTGLPPAAIKAILQYTALPLAGVDALTQGRGALNASGAVALAQIVTVPVPSGSWSPAGLLAPATTIGGESWTWSRTFVWGSDEYLDTIVWGNIDWSDTIVWGNYDLGDDTIVWGNIEWDDTIVWGNGEPVD